MTDEIKSFLTQKWQIVMFTGIVSVFIMAGGYIYYQSEKERINTEKTNELKTISELKVSQIAYWRKERINDVLMIAQSTFFKDAIHEFLNSGANKPLESRIKNRLIPVLRNSGYEDILITNRDGKILLSLKSEPNRVDKSTLNVLKLIEKKNKADFSDLYFCTTHQEVHLDIIAPFDSSDGKASAFLILRNNPQKYFFPLLKYWPVNNKTAETLIITEANDSALYLYKSQHDNKSMQTAFPLARTDNLGVSAVNGHSGIWQGKDYHGTEVIAFVTKVPDSPWYLVVKVDKAELLSELYSRAAVIFIFVTILILLMAVGFSWLYHYRQKNVYKKLFLTEKDLHQTEEEFKTTLYSIGDGVITTNLSGNIKQMNSVAEELTGWKEKEARGRLITEVFNIINEETCSEVDNPVEKVIREGVVVGLANHTLLISKNGKSTPISDSGAPIIDKKGKLSGVVLIFQDQTGKRESERKLRESEKQYRSLFTTMLEGFALHEIICDSNNNPVDYRFLTMNPAFERLTGLKAENCMGKTVVEVLPDIEKYWIENYGKVALTGEPLSFENYSQELNKYYSVVAFSPAKNQFAVIFTDVTDRKLAELELKKQKYLMDLLMDNIPDHIYFKDLESRFIRISKAQANAYNLEDPSQAIGKTDYDFFTEEHAREASDDEHEIIKTGIPLFKEERETWADKPDSWVSTVKMPLRDNDGKIIGTFGLSRDITSRVLYEYAMKEKTEEIEAQNEEYRQLNEELQKAKDKAEESDRLKTAFLQNLSHEIRTPMNAIMGFSGLLTSSFNDKPKLEQYSNIINQRCYDLLDIINDILDIARIESGQLTLKTEEFSVSELLNELSAFYSEYQQRIGKQNIDFTLLIDGNASDQMIVTDKGKLKQIFVNLINNAFKFTLTGKISGGCQPLPDHKIMFYVSDTGIGIAPDKHKKIFERFTQLNQGTGRAYGGNGLGLAIVKGLVDLMEGEIWLESEPGKGTTFYFTIPYKKASNTSVSSKKERLPSEKSFHGKTMLVVDDDPNNLEFLTEILVKTNCKILTADNGSKALEVVENNPVDLVLLDIRLPDIEGYEVSKRMIRKFPALKIVAQTAYAFPQENEKAKRAGCAGYISKPIKKEELINLISGLLE